MARSWGGEGDQSSDMEEIEMGGKKITWGLQRGTDGDRGSGTKSINRWWEKGRVATGIKRSKIRIKKYVQTGLIRTIHCYPFNPGTFTAVTNSFNIKPVLLDSEVSFSRQQLWNFGGISLELPFKYKIDTTSQDWKFELFSTAHLVMNCDAWATDTPFHNAHCD